MKISLCPNDLKKELVDRNSQYLFHANSVETSITFARNGALLSRENCDKNRLPQSTQWSDKKDKRFDIYSSLFLNLQDLHHRFARPNQYGPILFRFKSEETAEYIITNNIEFGVTKKQPHEWESTDAPTDRWVSSFSEVFPNPPASKKAMYTNGWPDIVLSVASGTLPLNLLHSIIIDRHPTSDSFNQQLHTIFENCMKGHGLDVKIHTRNFCVADCQCKTDTYIKSNHLEYKYKAGGWENTYGKIA